MATTPNFEEFQDFSKQQLEAITAASSTWPRASRRSPPKSTDYSKKAFAAGSAAIEKLLGAKSIEAAIQIQTDYAKQAYEGFVAQASKFSELFAKLADRGVQAGRTAFSPRLLRPEATRPLAPAIRRASSVCPISSRSSAGPASGRRLVFLAVPPSFASALAGSPFRRFPCVSQRA